MTALLRAEVYYCKECGGFMSRPLTGLGETFNKRHWLECEDCNRRIYVERVAKDV